MLVRTSLTLAISSSTVLLYSWLPPGLFDMDVYHTGSQTCNLHHQSQGAANPKEFKPLFCAPFPPDSTPSAGNSHPGYPLATTSAVVLHSATFHTLVYPFVGKALFWWCNSVSTGQDMDACCSLLLEDMISNWVSWRPLCPGCLPKYTADSPLTSHQILIAHLYLVKPINSGPDQFSYSTQALA